MKPASPNLSSVAGLILAGGRSSRFGADKALARFRGELMVDRAHRPLEGLPAVAISAKRGSPIAAHAGALGMALVTDDEAAPEGPLAGLLAGLSWASAQGFSFLATVPCDTPVLPHDLVPTLLAERRDANAVYAQTSQGSHPLCAIWSVELRTLLRSSLADGRHPAVQAFLAEIGARPAWFESAHAFANANTRDILSDLEQGI